MSTMFVGTQDPLAEQPVIGKHTAEFEDLMGLRNQQTVEWFYAATCQNCGEHRSICWVIENTDKDKTRETWCLWCIRLAEFRSVSWKQRQLALNSVPKEMPVSPW